MIHQEQKAQASDPLAVGNVRRKRTIYDFLEETDDNFIEYLRWKNETDEVYFELYGEQIAIHSCNFLEYLEWIRLEETEKLNPDEVEVTQDTIDADFEYL